jgi:hypothetical protein
MTKSFSKLFIAVVAAVIGAAAVFAPTLASAAEPPSLR